MQSKRFVIIGTRRLNRRQCSILVHYKTNPLVSEVPFVSSLSEIMLMTSTCEKEQELGNYFEVHWPSRGPLHYGDTFEGYPKFQEELTDLIERYTGKEDSIPQVPYVLNNDLPKRGLFRKLKAILWKCMEFVLHVKR